jgi:hypothetical protein
MSTETTPSNTSAPVSDANPATTNHAAELAESGGTIGFDSARSLRAAFEAAETTPAKDAPAAPAAEPAAPAAAPETTPAAPAVEPAATQPTADAVAELLGGAPAKKGEEEPLPAEIASATDKAKSAWAEQRRALKEERRRREELETKLVEFERGTKEVAPDEVVKLREQNEAYENELRLTRVEATREYKEAVVAPRDQIRSAVKAIASRYEIKSADLEAAVAEGDAEKQTELLTDLAGGMGDRDRFRIYEMADAWGKTENIRGRIAANAKLALEKIEAHRAEQEKQYGEERTKRYLHALDKVSSDVVEKVPLLRPREGDDKWNAQIAEIHNFARSVNFDNVQDETQRAGLAFRAAVSPFLYGLLQEMFTKYQQTAGELAKYRTATPAAGGGSPAAETSETKHDDFLSAVKAGLS